MSKLQKLQCDNCGGRIDGATLICVSCGMQYRLNDDMTLGRVTIFHGQFQLLEGNVAVPAYVLSDVGPEKFCEMTLKALADEMAPKILPFMEFQSMMDHRTMDIQTFGRLRVGEPIHNHGRVLDDVINQYKI